MDDYFKNSKYRIGETAEDESGQENETDSSLFDHKNDTDSLVKFFNSHPKRVLENGQKIFNHRLFERDLGVGSFSQTYCLSEVKSVEDLAITDDTKGILTFENESSAPKEGKIALRVYNTITLANQRKIDYETMEWTNNLQRLISEVQLWLDFSGKSPHLCELYAIYESPESEKVYLEIELGDLGLVQKFDEDDRIYRKSSAFVQICNTHYQNVASEQERIFLGMQQIFCDLVDGLEYLHSLRIAHRDLKIDNFILCSLKGETERLPVVAK